MKSSSRILIVDDDESVATSLELILSAGQFDGIVVASNAEDAFDILDLTNDDPELPPAVDVIVLDVIMPEIDGIEACARIRKTRRYRDVPIIMCSGLDEINSLNQAFIAGAHDYLTKPIRKVELLARARSAMRFKREIDRRRAREGELRRGPQVEQPGVRTSFIDANTGLPNQLGFEVAIRHAVAGAQPNGLLAVQIVDADLLLHEAGPEAASDLTAMVARAIASLPAPLDWKLYIFGDGLFIILAPNGSIDQLSLLGKRAAGAIDGLRIVHGHSLEDDFVHIGFAVARGKGTELLTLPAELIRSLDDREGAPGEGSAILPNHETRAA